MQPAVIFSLPSTTSHCYCWRWRSADGKTDSMRMFVYYHDCLADAEANGYSVPLATGQGNTAPGWHSLPAK